MAHPLGSGVDRATNIVNARKWLAWLSQVFENVVFSANWILIAQEWSEELGRKRGLEIDLEHVERADLLFLVGGKVSPGMKEELDHAAKEGVHIVDLTFLGWSAPANDELHHVTAGWLEALDNALDAMPSRYVLA